MRLLVVENNLSAQDKWIKTLEPHWPGKIELVKSNRDALTQLDGPYFFPLMVCRADRETILLARERGVQRFAIKPCEPFQLVHEINHNILGQQDPDCAKTQAQLEAIQNLLNTLCRGQVAVRQLLSLKQRCHTAELYLARLAVDQILSYMDKYTFNTVEVNNALLELTGYIQYRLDKQESFYCI